MARSRSAWSRLTALAGGVALLWGCGGGDETTSTAGTAPVVNVEAARTETLRDIANAPGMVVTSAAGDWVVVATDSAQIIDLPKKVGETVNTGDIVVRFDIPALTQEMAALELAVVEASSRLDRAKTDLARQTPLFEKGITSRNSYDASRLELSSAETAVLQARTRLETAKAAESRAIIRARFNGVVTEVLKTAGEAVRPGDDPILRIIDPASLQVAVELPLAQLARIVPGQSATIQAIAGATSEPGVVASKAESMAVAAPTGQVRLSFVKPPTLAVNSPVSVQILLDQRSNALTVPAAALQRDDLGTFVMVVDDANVVQRRDVRAGLVTTDRAQVVAGLAAGEQVVVGVGDAREGMTVVIAR